MLLPYGAAMVAYMLSDRLEARARSGYPLSWLGVTCFSVYSQTIALSRQLLLFCPQKEGLKLRTACENCSA